MAMAARRVCSEGAFDADLYRRHSHSHRVPVLLGEVLAARYRSAPSSTAPSAPPATSSPLTNYCCSTNGVILLPQMDHASVTPRRLSYDLLKEITDGFSEERKLGSGGYGKVYKGVHKDGETMAVKLLYDMPGLDDEQFKREFNNLMCLQHHNIVRLVGYCHDTRQEYVQYNGRLVVADKIYRALCFEYAPNRSLHENLSDEYSGIDWRTRYGIIKGVCDGLKYLHHELKPPMYHLDLKPANVLLDENMVPKIADFGLSRLFGEEQTKITLSSMGTRGYLPPEYIEQNVLSNKFDIFSLGVVIIKVMAGPMGYSKCGEMSSQEFVKLVHENWRTRLQTPPICEPEPEAYYEQVRTCIEIALRCVEVDRHKRPTISYIVDTMNETQTKIRLWSPLAQRSQSFASAITGLRRIEYSDLAAAIDIFSVDDQPSVPKRLKTGPALPNVPEHDIHKASNSNVNPGFLLQETHPKLLEQNENTAYLKQDADVKTDIRPLQKPVKISYPTDGNVPTARHNVMSTDVTALKSGKPKIKGVSLTELFTPEQINAHIDSLRLWIGQSKAKAEKNQLMLSFENENSCQLCKVEKLTFEPPPIYCSPCGAEIKRNAPFYTVGTGDTRHFFCIPCYNESRGDTIEVDGLNFLKARFEKIRNDEETEEWWVQCDMCECWQHQICALFNGRRNDGGQAEYTCPYCYIKEVECGLRLPLPQSAVLGASDLPRTVLSDHIEERLFKRLKLERQTRASQSGHSFDEVAGAEGLVVRVVSSVDKKVEVKPHFLENFQEDNYPTEFPYKSKAVLLFQKIEGVEVCLFGMYVQEFGAECAYPNQRRVYLSYLDSVKYFRPEIKAASGEALRTFVYHEILIGYLEYCKQRGFTSCYIWACPPLKGEDYILYCHPEIQKTPKSEKLREWFLAMLQKATKEEIVVELTNLYDHFFITMGECKAKVTASRLPYFDGDYWRGAAEDMINQIRQEEDDRKLQKKSKAKKIFTKKALKAAGYTDLSSNASKDAMLMQKLGETIYPMKDDFIMVHLQYSCSHCCILMSSGKRWACHQCRCFYICDKCYRTEQQLEERERHPSNSRDTHKLHPVDIVGVPNDTKDRDDILESEYFDDRQAFLGLCQRNHYQYDTLLRAKHSSMMVLYHLHNPSAPVFVTTCNVCAHGTETDQGWRCEVCPDFDVCNGCYHKGAVNHPHKLTNHPSAADRDAQNKEARQMRVSQLRKMLNLLVHASACRSGSCQHPDCRKVKELYRHGMQCKPRASGGCVLCVKMWYMLHLHARACRDSRCSVPRCRDLKVHLRRLQQQSDSRRRAAVNEMMRQRAAGVAST